MSKLQIYLKDSNTPSWWFQEGRFNFGSEEDPIWMDLTTHPDFELTRNPKVETDIAILTDLHLSEALDFDMINKYKYIIGWIFEPIYINPTPYRFLMNSLDSLYAVFTHNEAMVESMPEVFSYVPATSTFIDSERININYDVKSSLLGMVASYKDWLPGHKLRHMIYERFREKITTLKYNDVPGTSTYGNKSYYMEPTLFSIVVESCQVKGYFTEKVIDCFLTGNIPIYWGDDLSKYGFDNEGIFYFSDLDELEDIINNINQDEYVARQKAIEYNFYIAHIYIRPYEHMHRALIERGLI